MNPIMTQQRNPQMLNHVRAFLREEEGLTMVEYAIAGALVAAATVTAFTSLGSSVIARITALAADVAA
jgi:pilus assembly protein Flp/PilA